MQVATFGFFGWHVQQGLEIHCFWLQKKTVQRKTALSEVYTYVLEWIFFQKRFIWPCNAFGQNRRISSLMLCSTVYIIVVQVREKSRECYRVRIGEGVA